MDLLKVGKEREGGLVTQRNVDKAVVSESAHGGDDSGLLTTAEGAGGNEDTGVLAPVATGGPDGAGLVPEGLPLSREVTVTGGDTEEDGIVLQKGGGLNNGVVRLGGGVHLGENLLRESLTDPRWKLSIPKAGGISDQGIVVLVDGSLATSSLNTLLLSLSQLLDVAVHRVLMSRKLVAESSEGMTGIGGDELTYVDDSDLGSHGEWIGEG